MTASLSPVYQLCSKVNFNLVFRSVHTRSLPIRTSVNRINEYLFARHSIIDSCVTKRFLITTKRLCGTSGIHKTTVTGKPILSKQQAEELTLKLTSEERVLLLTAIQEYQSKIIKDEYLGMYRFNSEVKNYVFYCIPCERRNIEVDC